MIATLVERKSRITLQVPIPRDHSAQSVGDALIGALTKLPTGLRRSLACDQGNEMFHHQRIEQATGLKIYFADPHAPWQRPTNENTNGLLRQYFPKGTDLNTGPPASSAASSRSSTTGHAYASATEHHIEPCTDGHVSRHDDDSQRSLEPAPRQSLPRVQRPGSHHSNSSSRPRRARHLDRAGPHPTA